MAGYKNRQGRKPKASTMVDRQRGRDDDGSDRQRMSSAPAYLIGQAREEWRRMWHQLHEAGLIADLDLAALAVYCVAHARFLEAEAVLQGPPGFCPNCCPRGTLADPETPCQRPYHLLPEYGVLVRGRLPGSTIRSPYLAISKEAQRQMTWFMGEFGLTQASRSRLPRKKETSDTRRSWSPTPRTPDDDDDPREFLKMQVMAGKS